MSEIVDSKNPFSENTLVADSTIDVLFMSNLLIMRITSHFPGSKILKFPPAPPERPHPRFASPIRTGPGWTSNGILISSTPRFEDAHYLIPVDRGEHSRIRTDIQKQFISEYHSKTIPDRCQEKMVIFLYCFNLLTYMINN